MITWKDNQTGWVGKLIKVYIAGSLGEFIISLEMLGGTARQLCDGTIWDAHDVAERLCANELPDLAQVRRDATADAELRASLLDAEAAMRAAERRAMFAASDERERIITALLAEQSTCSAWAVRIVRQSIEQS